MKFIDLKCPNCGGRLIPVQGNQKIVACEYCGSQYVLEDDRVINYHIHQHVTPEGSGYKKDEPASDKSGVLAAAGILIGLAVLFAAGIGLSSSKPNYGLSYRLANSPVEYEADEEEEEGSKNVTAAGSPFYDVLVEGIYQEPAGFLSEEDLAKLKYISISTNRDFFQVDYSFDDPYGSEVPDIRHLALKPADWDTDDLAQFPQLTKIELSYKWADGQVLRELKNLKGLACYEATPRELSQWLEPGQLTELKLDSPESLEGLSAFENLEILSLEDVESPDIRQLVSMKGLRSLSVAEDVPSEDPFSDSGSSGPMTDYAALSVLTGLEELNLESSAIRDVNFLKSLTNLKVLSLVDTEAISLEPAGELSQLRSLRLEDNTSARDYDFLSRLTGLETLILDKDTSQPDPGLSSLEQLADLEVCGLMSVSVLGNLKSLKSLKIHGCNIDEIQSLSSLSGLEKLSCYSSWTYQAPLRSLNFLDGMTSLKYLDFCGIEDDSFWNSYGRNMEIYGDISGALNHVGLEELYLNKCVFGIDFGRLTDNPSLRVLQMKEVGLKKNFHIESYSGMTDIWYDDVSMDENIQFLTHYPGLRELYLDGNQITGVSFAAGLKELQRLGINNNYVTDLTPLNQLEKLEYLDIRQNPVSTTIEAGDSVEIVK